MTIKIDKKIVGYSVVKPDKGPAGIEISMKQLT